MGNRALSRGCMKYEWKVVKKWVQVKWKVSACARSDEEDVESWSMILGEVWPRSAGLRPTLPSRFTIAQSHKLQQQEEPTAKLQIELQKEPVEVQDFRKLTDHFRGIYRIYLNLIKKIRKMSTYNWMDLETPG